MRNSERAYRIALTHSLDDSSSSPEAGRHPFWSGCAHRLPVQLAHPFPTLFFGTRLAQGPGGSPLVCGVGVYLLIFHTCPIVLQPDLSKKASNTPLLFPCCPASVDRGGSGSTWRATSFAFSFVCCWWWNRDRVCVGGDGEWVCWVAHAPD